MTENTSIWPKVISVDPSIIKALSISTYESFPNALKEVITNSYDALATKVDIQVNLNSETIVIRDNGSGMDEADFDFYLRIAGKKREVKELRASKRKKIGKFGVGFLAVFPFFRDYSIVTKKSGSKSHMEAMIPCHLYFDSRNQFVNISDIKISGKTQRGKYESQDHFTEIVLKGFTEITRSFMYPDEKVKRGRYSIDNPRYLSPIDKLKWVLAEDLPLEFDSEYFQNWFFDPDNSLPFTVNFNSTALKRKVYAEDFILETNEEPFAEIGKIKFRYVIATNKKPIHPNEGRGLKIRNLNVGVGKRESFVGKTVQGGYPRLQQLTGEVHILDGMNDLIKVSRDAFNYSDDFEELTKLIAQKLTHHSAELQEESNRIKDEDINKIRSLKSLERPKRKDKTVLKKDKSANFNFNSSKGGEVPIFIEVSPPHNTDQDSIINEQREDAVRTLEFGRNSFTVKTDSWNYEDEDYPACQILNENELVINSRYPLFRGVKHTDVFIKMHLFLLTNFHEGLLTRESFRTMSNQILDIYQDYWKKERI